jgi:hypothetical protein
LSVTVRQVHRDGTTTACGEFGFEFGDRRQPAGKLRRQRGVIAVVHSATPIGAV